MDLNIPKMMKAVFLKEDGSLITREVPVPQPANGEVLVKMAAAPVNPSDLARIRNMGNSPERSSFIPGIEGSGLVVARGSGLLPRLRMGKRVACSSSYSTSGTWAEYMVTSASLCFPIPRSISYEQGSMLLVNPMTAVSFFDIIKQNKHKAVISTAAAGALGQMIALLGSKHKVSIINIVRNEQQKELLKARGVKYVLDSSDSDFTEHLHSLSDELHATLALDAIGGSFTQQLLGATPYGSTIIVYGNLSGNEDGTNLRPLVMENKKIAGFYLANWIKENNIIKTLRNINQVKQLLKNELKITVQERLPLEKAQQGIDVYLKSMSQGKVLLIPN